MINKKTVFRIIAVALAVLLVVPTALCEQPAWDCPECGRTGNTGNYCGGCGHSAQTTPPASTPAPTTAPTAKPTPEPIQTGAIIQFGHYPQTAAGDDNTPIEWLVLEVDARNNKALLISRHGLDAKPYNTQRTGVTWEECALRTWLNDEFYNKAFSTAEKSAILDTTVDNGKSQGYKDWNTSGGNNTKDKVFLLSYAEANKYFDVQHYSISGSGKNTKSRVAPTVYAIKRGASTYSINKTVDGTAAGWWWLRSPGDLQYDAAYVNTDGSLYSNFVRNGDAVVRPALWINLESDIF